MGILLCALVGGACFWAGGGPPAGLDSENEHGKSCRNRLSEIGELATVTYAYTNMAQFEQHNDFYGVKIPFTTSPSSLPTTAPSRPGWTWTGAEVSVQRHHGHHHTAGGGDPLPRDR